MDKKKLIYSICGVLIVLVAIFMVLNLKDNKKNKGKEVYTSDIKKTKEDSSNKTNNNSQFFRFLDDGTTISGLTEEGRKQTTLVIPKQAKSLRGLDLDNSVVEEVRFEADHDVNLESAFTTAKTLKKVTLPAELSVIPYMAFGSCEGLESIVIPAGVTKIDEYAFDYCTNLKEIVFSGTKCEYIGEYAFELCKSLEKITLPEGLKTIDKCAFFDCESLNAVTFPSTIKSIGKYAFNVKNISAAHFAANTQNIKIDSTSFGIRTSQMTVYIRQGSWMDKNRDAWNVGFTNIKYE